MRGRGKVRQAARPCACAHAQRERAGRAATRAGLPGWLMSERPASGLTQPSGFSRLMISSTARARERHTLALAAVQGEPSLLVREAAHPVRLDL
jgi:hypothetical protein